MSSHRAHVTSPSSISRARRHVGVVFAAPTIGLLAAGFIAAASSPASAADARVGLGVAADYAVLAGTTVTNMGNSVISGDLGLSPGSAVTGFPPGDVVNGSQHVADAVALDAQSDLTTAYNDAAGRPTAHDISGQDLGGMTLTPGVYEASSGMSLTGTLTLNAQGDSAAVFIFKSGSTLITASDSRVRFVNGGSACNVFWKVGSSATLGTSTDFIGTIMALSSAAVQHAAKVEGRVLARNGEVTLDNNVITAPSCSGSTGDGGGGATPTGTTTTGGGSIPGGSGSDGKTGSTPTDAITTPVIPTGHPSTGAVLVSTGSAGSSMHASSSTALFVLAGLAGAAALVAGILGFGPRRRRRS
jgi:type VI secretion system secreted protein VgrG